MHKDRKAKLNVQPWFPRYPLLRLSEGLNDWWGPHILKLSAHVLRPASGPEGRNLTAWKDQRPSKWKFGRIRQAAGGGWSQAGKLRWCEQKWLEGSTFSKKWWKDLFPRDWGRGELRSADMISLPSSRFPCHWDPSLAHFPNKTSLWQERD